MLLLSVAGNYVEMMLNCQVSFFVKCCCVVLVTVYVFFVLYGTLFCCLGQDSLEKRDFESHWDYFLVK